MKQHLTLIFFFAIILSLRGQNLPEKGICAHRGASFSHPENTITAIKEAVRLGVQMIEFDVRRTKDDKLILMHNYNVNKTTNGSGLVNELTADEIFKLDAGTWKDQKFAGEKVPFFDLVLDIIPDNIWMNIHVKEDIKTAEMVAKVLTERKKLYNTFIAVENDAVESIRKINNKVKICCMERGNSSSEYIANAIKVNADFVQLTEREFPFLNEIIPLLKEEKIKINFYFADDIDKAKHLFASGVDFVLANDVEKILPLAHQLFDKK